MAITFSTRIKEAGKNTTGIVVPDEVVAALGKSRNPKVVVHLKDHTWRGTVQVVDGKFMLSLSAANREAAGVEGGEQVDVTLEPDVEPRTVDVPDDLKAALASSPGGIEAFEALAYSRRKEFVRQVEDAKTQETRDRRIAKIAAEVGLTVEGTA